MKKICVSELNKYLFKGYEYPLVLSCSKIVYKGIKLKA